jgi:hypothetical protein
MPCRHRAGVEVIALLILNLDAIWGWVFNATLRLLDLWEKALVPIVEKDECAPGVCLDGYTEVKSSCPPPPSPPVFGGSNSPARRDSLYYYAISTVV